MEAVLTEREPLPQQSPEEVDLRALPQTTIRKVIKECVDKGLFDTTPEIGRYPLVDLVPMELAMRFKPQTKKKGRQTVRYSPA